MLGGRYARSGLPRRLTRYCAQMGRLVEARKLVERLCDITRAVFPADPQFRNSEYRELFLSGLRLAVGVER